MRWPWQPPRPELFLSAQICVGEKSFVTVQLNNRSPSHAVAELFIDQMKRIAEGK